LVDLKRLAEERLKLAAAAAAVMKVKEEREEREEKEVNSRLIFCI
jgi:hypothetical protein